MEKNRSMLSHIFGHKNQAAQQDNAGSLSEAVTRDEDSVIKIEGLNIYIHNNHILKDVNLTLHDKKITCIIGPSGCGKTTLLRSINRMIDTTEHLRVEGRVLVGGEDIYDRKAEITHIRKKIGLLSQRPTPLPMSIYDNITYGCRIHGVRNRKVLDATVEKYLKGVNLWEEVKDRLHSPASALSIGQQQRLCLARRGTPIYPGRRVDLGTRPHIEQTHRRSFCQTA